MKNTDAYRVTSKIRGKKKVWIIQRKSDRKTMSNKPFTDQMEAIEAMMRLDPKVDPNIKFHQSWKEYADYRIKVAEDPNTRVTVQGVQGYTSDWNLRISKYMPDVPLCEFNSNHMKEYLRKAADAGHTYKVLKRSVRNIKTFLRDMKADGKSPNLDCLQFKIHQFHEVIPENDDLYYEKVPNVISEKDMMKVLKTLTANRYKDKNTALAFAIFVIAAKFGLRRSEIIGIKKQNVDLENKVLRIQGVYDYRSNTYKNKTKNRGSKRDIPLDDEDIKFFTLWFDYLKQIDDHTGWLLPATRGTKPISFCHVTDLVWKTYGEAGLAEVKKEGGHYSCISSPYKDAPLKTFRHRVATKLINAMTADKNLDINYVKSLVGHTRFQTTRDRYGNHNLIGSQEEVDARVASRKKALSLNLD